jgi:PhoH-like ATPase
MRKNYILDTNVLIHDPQSIFQFQDNHLYVPVYVLEELDRIKSEQSLRGRNSREACRIIDEFRCQGSLAGGVDVGDGKFFIYVPKERKPLYVALDTKSVDSAILQSALEIKESTQVRTILVTMDVNLRVRAESIGIQTAPYESQSVDPSRMITGQINMSVGYGDIDELYKNDFINVDDNEFYDNICIMMTDPGGKTALGRYRKKDRVIVPVHIPNDVMGIKARNKEQQFALDLLLDDSIKLVSLVGIAGCGKTLLASAAGLSKVLEGHYSRLLISRPIVPMGKDIGYLPGSVSEKLDPWMKPIYDNIELLMMQKGKKSSIKYKDLFDQDLLRIEPLTYIRGRSIPNQFLIVDECFPYDTLITTELGKRKIGGLFTQWVRGKELPLVKSFDEKTNTFVWKKITKMFYQGIRNIITVTAGNRKIKCTPNHPFLTDRGWIKAEELTPNDLIVADHPDEIQINKALSSDCEQILLGSFLGDGSIEMGKNRVGRLSIIHGLQQSGYCQWKAQLFQSKLKIVKNAGYNPEEDKVSFCSKSYGLPGYFPRPKTTCPQFVLDKLDPRGLAIWFMDDGSVYPNFNGARIHTESFDDDSVNRMISKLNEFGINGKKADYKGNVITLDKDSYLIMCDLISPFMHDDLMYKLPMNYRERNNYNWDCGNFEFGYVQVMSIEDLGVSDHVFDLEVEDTHNFLIPSSSRVCGQGSLVVHNCQNLSPHEIKTIITRCGEGSKVVLTGDPDQIDNPYMDKATCGLSLAVEKLHNNPIVGHLTLSKGERSELANLAATLM